MSVDAASIRPLREGDVAPVAAICNAAISLGESTLGPHCVSEGELRRWLLDAPPRFATYVYEDRGGAVVGWAGLVRHAMRPIYDRIAELVVFVAPEERRQGIGRALMDHAVGQATSALGFHSLVLLLQPDPTHPIVLALRRLGFQAVGGLIGVLPVSGEWRDVLVFQKMLTPAPASGR